MAGDGGSESLLVVTVRDVTAERRERADLAERAKEMENRITSYNVCYTKLLRIEEIFETSLDINRD